MLHDGRQGDSIDQAFIIGTERYGVMMWEGSCGNEWQHRRIVGMVSILLQLQSLPNHNTSQTPLKQGLLRLVPPRGADWESDQFTVIDQS